MLLYRALNYDDLNNLNNNNNIYSSLINSYNLNKIKEVRRNVFEYYNLCILGKCEYALDTIIGHISGKRIGASISPWISVTSNFKLAASEYSIPQSGHYNYIRERKPIVIIDLPNDKILSSKEEILNIRERNDIKDYAVDLRNDNLNILFNSEAVLAEKYNEDMPGYDVVASINKDIMNGRTRVNGFSNYATAVSELLIFAGIKKNHIKAILSPQLVDILYSCDIDIENNYEFIINNYLYLNECLLKLNDEFIGKNLTDYLIKNYNNISGNNIEEKYKNLKLLKLKVVSKAVDYINKKYKTNFEVSKLLDDEVLVRCYENISNLSLTSKNDLLIIEKDDELYVHDFNKNGFYNSKLNSVITMKSVRKIIENSNIEKTKRKVYD